MKGQLFNQGQSSGTLNIDQQFRLYYNHTLYPELKQLERRRKVLLTALAFCILLASGTLLGALYSGMTALILFSAIPTVLLLVAMVFSIRSFRSGFKPRVVTLLLAFIKRLPDIVHLEFHTGQKLPVETFLRSAIFTAEAPAFYEGEDLIRGTIGNTTFELSEIDARAYSRVRSKLDTLFQGVFLRAKPEYMLQGKLLVIPRTQRKYLSRTIKLAIGAGAEKVQNGLDAGFANDFLVYATHKNQNPEAHLPETTLHQIFPLGLQRFLGTYFAKTRNPVYVAFHEETIYLAIGFSKDILEPSILTSNLNFDRIQDYVRDIMMLLTLVNRLDKMYD